MPPPQAKTCLAILNMKIVLSLFPILHKLEGAARYTGLLLAPAESFGLRPRPFFALWAKKDLFMSVLAQMLVIFGDQ